MLHVLSTKEIAFSNSPASVKFNSVKVMSLSPCFKHFTIPWRAQAAISSILSEFFYKYQIKLFLMALEEESAEVEFPISVDPCWNAQCHQGQKLFLLLQTISVLFVLF